MKLLLFSSKVKFMYLVFTKTMVRIALPIVIINTYGSHLLFLFYFLKKGGKDELIK